MRSPRDVLATSPRQKNPEGLNLPETDYLFLWNVLLIEFHLIAYVDILQREH